MWAPENALCIFEISKISLQLLLVSAMANARNARNGQVASAKFGRHARNAAKYVLNKCSPNAPSLPRLVQTLRRALTFDPKNVSRCTFCHV